MSERIEKKTSIWTGDSHVADLYLPTNERNQQSMLDLVGLDPEDLSRYNVRNILFAKPYREYGIAFGLPCSAFASSLGTHLQDNSVPESLKPASYSDAFSG